MRKAEGPWFEELEVGDTFDNAPPYTLTAGRQAVHQAIVGDRLWLPLNDDIATAIAGRPIAHPAFVWDVAIGQSTIATQHVKANLFYRNLSFHRIPLLGDTLRTVTSVVALRENKRHAGRAPTGLVVLRMITADEKDRIVLDFYRCAMLPLRADIATGHNDDLDLVGSQQSSWDFRRCLDALHLKELPDTHTILIAGDRINIIGGDVVSSAPELARLTLNIANVHHDEAAAGGRRLVYGGHTIGLALSQATRAIPSLVTILAWHSCDHLGPVFEGDTLYSDVEVEAVEQHSTGETIAHLRSHVYAGSTNQRPVLDWRFVALVR